MRDNSKSTLSGFLGLDTCGLFGILLALYWTSNNIIMFLRGLFAVLLGPEIVDYFVPVLFGIFGLLALPYIIKKIRWYDFFFFLLIILYFFCCYSWYPQNVEYLEDIKGEFLFFSLPAVFVGLSLDYNKCGRLLYVVSVLAVLLTTMSTLLGGGAMGTGENEDLSRAYGMLAPTLVVVVSFLKSRRIIDLCFSFIGVIHLFALGTRGPLACLVLFLVLYFLIFTKYKNPWLTRSFFIILLVLFVVFMDSFIELFGSISSSFGLSTRIAETSESGELMDSSGRSLIYANVFSQTLDGPFWGGGLCADRLYNSVFLYDTYAHNIALEMWADFGIVLGSFFLLSIIIVFIIAIKNNNKYEERVFLLVMFVAGVCSLLLSSSYLKSRWFFLAIGVFIAYARRKQIVNSPQVSGRRVSLV